MTDQPLAAEAAGDGVATLALNRPDDFLSGGVGGPGDSPQV